MFLGGSRPEDKPINAHTELAADGIAYVAYPPPNSDDVRRYASKCDQSRALSRGDRNVVFIGQVPRLLPLPYVPWALDLLLEEYGVTWVLQTQQNSCAKAWTESEAQADELVRRNKRLLFDVCGVWVARTPAQVERIFSYQSTMQMRGPLDGRVPRHGIIIEPLKPARSTVAPQRTAQPVVSVMVGRSHHPQQQPHQSFHNTVPLQSQTVSPAHPSGRLTGATYQPLLAVHSQPTLRTRDNVPPPSYFAIATAAESPYVTTVHADPWQAHHHPVALPLTFGGGGIFCVAGESDGL
jgi:hypothetical protein